MVHSGGGLKVRAHVCLLHSDEECLPPPPGTFECGSPLQCSRHEAPTDPASSLLLHGARRMQTEGACSCLPLALGWRVLAVPIKHMQVSVITFATYSRHDAPTDRASSRLLHGPQRSRPEGACSCLPLALGWRVLAVPTTMGSPAGVDHLCNEAAMKR